MQLAVPQVHTFLQPQQQNKLWVYYGNEASDDWLLFCQNSAAHLGWWGRHVRCGACYWPGMCRCRAPHRSLAPCRCGWRSRCCCCWPVSRACPVTTCLSRWTGCWSGSARLCGSPLHQSDTCERTGRSHEARVTSWLSYCVTPWPYCSFTCILL